MRGTTVGDRLRELARRAGLAETPPAVVLAVMALAACALVWAGLRWWPRATHTGGERFTVRGSTQAAPATGAADPSGLASDSAAPRVVVHVAGAVRRPGVYELPAGSRVADAIDRAGGAIGDAALEALNLARLLQDGEQVLVPTAAQAAQGAPASTGAASGAAPSGPPGGPVDLNSADAALLDTLPGVGPSTAARIIADREANGPFARVEDLGRVSGIGPKKLEQLADLVCVR